MNTPTFNESLLIKSVSALKQPLLSFLIKGVDYPAKS